MADLPNSNLDTDMELNRESPPSTPRWVKVIGIIAVVLVLLVVIMLIFGGGDHGPGRHRLPSSFTEQGVQQP